MPESMKIQKQDDVCVQYDYTYYLAAENKETLQIISQAMATLYNKGLRISVRPHPRYTDMQRVKEMFEYTAVFTLGCIAVMLVGPELMLIFGGKQYMSAIGVIPPICFSVSLQFIYTLYVNVEFYLKKTKYISFATLGATIINIGANFLLIPHFGYVAAAYASIIGFVFMVVFHYFVCKKTEYRRLFDIKIFLLNVAVCLVSMILILLLYKSNFVRLQPTSPLRTTEDIQGAFALLKEKNVHNVVSVTETAHPVQWCFALDETGSLADFSFSPYTKMRRQDLKKHYQVNGAIYVVDAKKIMDVNYNLYADNCYAYVMPRSHSIDIDEEVDLIIAKAIIEKRM